MDTEYDEEFTPPKYTKPGVQPFEILSPTFDTSKIQRVPIKLKKLYPVKKVDDSHLKVAFLLKNVFTKQECKELIDLSEKNGYGAALLNIGGGREMLETSVRKSSRTIIDDEEFAKILMERIRPFIPDPFENHAAVGINERLRFLRYDPGDVFHMHQDGCYVRPGGKEKSMVTLQIYLNEGFEGGETTFIAKKNIPIVPEEGMILVFQHNITHEGSELKAGRKYTVRTEVMYNSRRN